jgi:hypothetical protein
VGEQKNCGERKRKKETANLMEGGMFVTYLFCWSPLWKKWRVRGEDVISTSIKRVSPDTHLSRSDAVPVPSTDRYLLATRGKTMKMKRE